MILSHSPAPYGTISLGIVSARCRWRTSIYTYIRVHRFARGGDAARDIGCMCVFVSCELIWYLLRNADFGSTRLCRLRTLSLSSSRLVLFSPRPRVDERLTRVRDWNSVLSDDCKLFLFAFSTARCMLTSRLFLLAEFMQEWSFWAWDWCKARIFAVHRGNKCLYE